MSSQYLQFSRQQWCQFRDESPLMLSKLEVDQLTGVNEVVSLSEVEDIYLPLSRLLSFYVTAMQSLHEETSYFLGGSKPKVPYIIGVAGSVAVGKSTISRLLQALLSRWPKHPKVALVTTDGFLYPLAELQRRNLLSQKGFPESYDLPSLLAFLRAVKSGEKNVSAPVYSHHQYDILKDQKIVVDRPDILIVEGLNILQIGPTRSGVFVSDFFDFTIFVDAEIEAIKGWFIERIQSFRKTVFKDPSAYFHFVSKLSRQGTEKFARRIWWEINERNLLQNILPFKNRARLILQKGIHHAVEKVWLRKL